MLSCGSMRTCLREVQAVDAGRRSRARTSRSDRIRTAASRPCRRFATMPTVACGSAGARVDEDVALRIRRHAGRLAEMNVVRQLQEIGVRVVRQSREWPGRRARCRASRGVRAGMSVFIHASSSYRPADDFAACGLKNDFLHAPAGDLRDEQLVGVAAVDFVHRAELLQRFARLAELADDRAVELHLVDLAGLRRRPRVAVVGHRVRDEQVLMRTRRDADRPRIADLS